MFLNAHDLNNFLNIYDDRSLRVVISREMFYSYSDEVLARREEVYYKIRSCIGGRNIFVDTCLLGWTPSHNMDDNVRNADLNILANILNKIAESDLVIFTEKTDFDKRYKIELEVVDLYNIPHTCESVLDNYIYSKGGKTNVNA